MNNPPITARSTSAVPSDAPVSSPSASARRRAAVGLCGRKFPGAAALGPLGLLRRCAELGYDGVFFRTIIDVTPTLDRGVLADVRSLADELGLYLEMGLGKINPYNASEDHHIRDLGDGDYLLGMTRMIEAASAIDCRVFWADTANSQSARWGLFSVDRFRTDTTWTEQLRATTAFVEQLVPVLDHHEGRLAVETHEEITTDELLRMADRIGERFGVTLDLANVVVRGEDPVAATRRVAPLVNQTHMRDVALFVTPTGLRRQIRACGDGIIDWVAVLDALAAGGSTTTWTIENAWGDHADIPLRTPQWQQAHPDLRLEEVAALVQHAHDFAAQVAAGERPSAADYDGPDPVGGQLAFVVTSAATLRAAAQLERLAHATERSGS